MPTAYSKNDHANGKERHEEILPLASKAGWNVPKTKVDGNDIRQLRYPQKKPCEGNQANHQTGNINNQTEPVFDSWSHPIAQPYIEVRGLLFPVALKRPLPCEPTDTRNDMAEIERRGLGQRFDSLVARTEGSETQGHGPLAPDQHGQTQSATLGASLPSPSVYKLLFIGEKLWHLLLSDGEKFEVYLRSVLPTPSHARSGTRACRGSQS